MAAFRESLVQAISQAVVLHDYKPAVEFCVEFCRPASRHGFGTIGAEIGFFLKDLRAKNVTGLMRILIQGFEGRLKQRSL